MAFWNKGKTNSNIGANPLGGLIQRMWSRAPTKDKSQYPNLLHQNPRLDPVAVIARSVASTEWRIFDKRELRKSNDAAEPILDHELYDLLDNPIKRYPEIDWYSLCYLTTALTKLVGECFWIKVRDQSGNVIELDPIPPAWVTWTPTINNPTFNIYPFGVTAGKVLVASADDVIWFKRPDLNDPYGRGRGDAEPLEDEAEMDEYAAKSQKNFFYNDSTPPFALFAPGVTPDGAAQLKQDWQAKFGGWMNRRSPAVIPFPNANIQQLAMSPVEMDMIESRKFIRDEFRQHFQIPPEILGDIQNSNRATIDSAEYLFYKNVLCYEFRFIERVLNRQLIECEFDRTLCFKFQEEIPEDEAFKLQVLNAGIDKMLVKRSEWRKAFHLPVDPKKDDVYIGTFSLYEIPADGSDMPEPPKPSGQTTDKPSDDENSEASIAEDIGIDTGGAKGLIFEIVDKSIEHEEIEIEITHNKASDPRKVAIWKAFDARATAKEGEFIEAVKKFSKKQKTLFVDAINTYEGTDANTAISKGFSSAFGPSSDKALKSALSQPWTHSMESGRDHAYDMLGNKKSVKADSGKVDPSFTVTNEAFRTWVETNGLLKAEGINETTNNALRKKLAQAISDGISEGKPYPQIKNDLLDIAEGVYEDFDTRRAALIGRNESMQSVNWGTHSTLKAEGIEKREWMSVQDDRTREDHADADGQVVGIDEPFMVGGERLAYPGDPSGSAENTIQCRCSELAIIE